MEHPAPIEAGSEPQVAVADVGGGFDLWVLVDGMACSTAQVRTA